MPRPQATDHSTAESKASKDLSHSCLPQISPTNDSIARKCSNYKQGFKAQITAEQKAKEKGFPSRIFATDDSTAGQSSSYKQGLKPQVTAQQTAKLQKLSPTDLSHRWQHSKAK